MFHDFLRNTAFGLASYNAARAPTNPAFYLTQRATTMALNK